MPLPETQPPLSPRHRGSLRGDTERPSPRLDGPFGALDISEPAKPSESSKPTKPDQKRRIPRGQCSRYAGIAMFSPRYGFRQIAFLRQRSGFWRPIIRVWEGSEGLESSGKTRHFRLANSWQQPSTHWLFGGSSAARRFYNCKFWIFGQNAF